MPSTKHQKLPEGFVFIEDYEDEDGNVTPGIATRLGITVSTYRKWRMAGKGPATFRHGKRQVARKSVVDAYLASLGQNEGSDGAAEHDSRPPEPRVGRQRRHQPEPKAA